jgi:hypothetical protein
MRTALAIAALFVMIGCGSVKSPATVDAPVTDPDAPATIPTPATSIAPTVGTPMYQGSQTHFKTQLGTTCTGRVAASMAGTGFCYLAADDNVKCAGVIGGVNFGMSLGSTGQTGASQIMVMFLDNGMCITRTDHTTLCMGTNTNAFGAGGTSTTFTRWTAHADIADIGSGTWDQICGITLAGQVFCGGTAPLTNPPANIGPPGQTSVWVDTFGMARLSDTAVLRPAEGRTECQVKANGLVCAGLGTVGPTNGTIVMGSQVGGGGMSNDACYLTSDGTVTCTFGPRFEVGKVLFLAESFYTDSLCAIYNDGAVWCIGSNSNGKLGTGNNATLTVETMVAPPGSAHVACDP